MREFGNVPLIADVTRSKWGGLRLEREPANPAFRPSPAASIAWIDNHRRAYPGFGHWGAHDSSKPGQTLSFIIPGRMSIRRVSFASLMRRCSVAVATSMHYDQYCFLRQSGRSWKNAISFAQTSVNLAQPVTQSRAITAGVVSSNFFDFLGFSPQSGRFFQSGNNDRAYGANDEIVLSDRDFGGTLFMATRRS